MISCNGVMFSGHGVATAETMVLGIVGRMLADLDDVAHAEAVAAVRASLTAHLGADGVTYPSAMWLVTAERSAVGQPTSADVTSEPTPARLPDGCAR